MLAQLFETKGMRADQVVEYAKNVVERTRQMDGCENVFVLSDGSDAGLALAVWRDRASMEAAAARQREDIDKTADDIGVTIVSTKIYDVVIAS